MIKPSYKGLLIAFFYMLIINQLIVFLFEFSQYTLHDFIGGAVTCATLTYFISLAFCIDVGKSTIKVSGYKRVSVDGFKLERKFFGLYLHVFYQGDKSFKIALFFIF